MSSTRNSTKESNSITLGKLMFLIPVLGIFLILAVDYWGAKTEVNTLSKEVQRLKVQIETIQQTK
jgi:cell division protein FtsL